MELELHGKRALVTGSTTGVGFGIAHRLLAEGASVVVHGRSAQTTEAAAAELARTVTGPVDGQGATGRVSFAYGDLSTDAGAQQTAELTLAGGPVDVLVNNAGAYALTGFWDTPSSTWTRLYETDVVSGVRMVQLLAPAMAGRGWGRIVQVSSASAELTPSNMFPFYAAAKAAQVQLGKSLAVELGPSGITVNTVSPGPVATANIRAAYTAEAAQDGVHGDWPDIQAWYVAHYLQDPPVSRMADVDDVATVVAFLASPLAGHITAANYLVDGGYSVTGFSRRPSQIPTVGALAATAPS